MGLPLPFRINMGSGSSEARPVVGARFYLMHNNPVRWIYYPFLSSQGNWNLKQLNNLPKVTKLRFLSPGQREWAYISGLEWGRGGKNNLSSEILPSSNPGHKRLEWKILILFGFNHGLLLFFFSDARGGGDWQEVVLASPRHSLLSLIRGDIFFGKRATWMSSQKWKRRKIGSLSWWYSYQEELSPLHT